MQREIGNQSIEDFANDNVSDFEHNHILEPFMQDLKACEKLDETADTLLAAAQVSKEPAFLNEPISSKSHQTVVLQQITSSTNAFDLKPLTETTVIGLDRDSVASHGSEFLYESSSDGQGIERTFETTDITEEHTFEKLSKEMIDEVVGSHWPRYGRHIICTSNYFPEDSHTSLESLENSDIELSTCSDELSDLDIEEDEPSSDCDSATGKEEVESVHEETSCQPLFYNYPSTQYMNATSDIGLGLTMKRVPEEEPSWSDDESSSSSNSEIYPAGQSSKRKLTTSKPQLKDNSKKFKGRNHYIYSTSIH